MIAMAGEEDGKQEGSSKKRPVEDLSVEEIFVEPVYTENAEDDGKDRSCSNDVITKEQVHSVTGNKEEHVSSPEFSMALHSVQEYFTKRDLTDQRKSVRLFIAVSMFISCLSSVLLG